VGEATHTADRGATQREKAAQKGYKIIGTALLSPYFTGKAFCGCCGTWWRLDSVPRDRRGAPLCPRCRQQLRVRPLRPVKTQVWRAYLDGVRLRA